MPPGPSTLNLAAHSMTHRPPRSPPCARLHLPVPLPPPQILRPFLLRRLKADVEQEEAELRAAEARAAEARAAAARACERVAKIKRAHAPLNALQSRPPQPLVARSSTPALDPTSLSWSTPQPVDSLRREMQAIGACGRLPAPPCRVRACDRRTACCSA